MSLFKILLTLIFFSFASLVEADWPKFRGPSGEGIWDCPDLPLKLEQPEKIWKKEIGGGYSGVTIVGDKVFTMDRPSKKNKERVLCYSAKNGNLIWAHEYDANYSGLSYDSGPRASVTIKDGKVFSFGAVGHMHCLNEKDGKVIWKHDSRESFGAKRPIWGFASSPAIWKDLIIYQIGGSSGGYVALNPNTGERVWSSSKDPSGYAMPVFVNHTGKDLMLAWTPENIKGILPRTGEELWSIPYKVKYGVSIALPIFHENIVLVCGYWHGSKAIQLGDDMKSAKLLWEDEENIRGLMAQPLQKDGLAYLIDRTNGLCCFEIKTGKRLWDDSEKHTITPSGRNPQATLVWAQDGKFENRALIFNANGELLSVTLNREGFEIHSRAQITGKTWAHPAYSDEHIYARTDNEIVCWKLINKRSTVPSG